MEVGMRMRVDVNEKQKKQGLNEAEETGNYEERQE